MGLGLFIAKTLLERSGASLLFANGIDEERYQGNAIGAVVEVRWPRSAIDARSGENALPFGENTRFAEV